MYTQFTLSPSGRDSGLSHAADCRVLPQSRPLQEAGGRNIESRIREAERADCTRLSNHVQPHQGQLFGAMDAVPHNFLEIAQNRTIFETLHNSAYSNKCCIKSHNFKVLGLFWYIIPQNNLFGYTTTCTKLISLLCWD